MTADAPPGLVFVGDRCCDHSPSSGYDQVCALFEAAGWLSGRGLEAGEERWIRAAAEPASPRVLHVFYGDCSGSAAVPILRERWPDATILLSVHQPVDRMRQDAAAMRACADADAILTVSERQATELAALKLPASIRAIAHGVWTERFAPARSTGAAGSPSAAPATNSSAAPATGSPSAAPATYSSAAPATRSPSAAPSTGSPSAAPSADRCEVLLVGNYLRDWPAIARIVDLLATRGVRCRLVGTNAPGHRFAGHASVTVSPKLSERELADAYDSAAALLMPVLDATASNALLEAISAGCPVVCSDAPSLVDEYLGDRVDAFAAGDCEAAVARLLHYVHEPRARAARSKTLRARARRFDWSTLAPRYAAAFSELAGERAAPGSLAR